MNYRESFIQVLLIEDNQGDARLICEQLRDTPHHIFKVKHAKRLTEGLEHLASEPFDVVLLDLSLPDSFGIETMHRIIVENGKVPIVVLTGTDDEDLAIKAVQEGAQDYLIKGHGDNQLLSRSLRYAIERKRSEERLKYLATHDLLTDIPNRSLFEDRLMQAIQRINRARHGGKESVMAAVLLLDLDGFKGINDMLGHKQGDMVLRIVADRFKNCIRRSDTVARVGGDEFTFILEGITGMEDCELMAKRIGNCLAEPLQLEGQNYVVRASIGISLYPEDSDNPDMLIKQADKAMYFAKQSRRSYSFYKQSIISAQN